MIELLLMGGKMGASIKSMQRGNATVNAGTLNIPLSTPVNASKSVVLLNRAVVNNGTDSLAGISGLTSSALSLSISAGANTVDWTVVELAGVKAVHKGTVTMTTNISSPVNVAGIDMSKSFVLLNYGADTVVTGTSDIQVLATYFDYSDNTIKRKWNGGTLVVYYQIIEFI